MQTLLQECVSELGTPQQLVCAAYIGGIGDVMSMNGVLIRTYHEGGQNLRKFAICAPDPMSYGAAVQAFVAWGHRHPERWDTEKLPAVLNALQETWPCQ
jgi:hypothetical protein